MKSSQWILILTVCLGLFSNNAKGQNIRGDTIYVDVNSVVGVYFPSKPNTAELIGNEERLYKVDFLGEGISILELKQAPKTLDLKVTEGNREHVFVLSHKQGSLVRPIRFTRKKDLTKRSNEVRMAYAKRLEEANKLFTEGKKNLSDEHLWQKLEATYSGFLRFLEPKDTAFARSRIGESHKQLEFISRDKKYAVFMKKGQDFLHEKNFPAAGEAYDSALNYKPGDPQATKYIALTDSLWCKVYIDSGDVAFKAKNYVSAKKYYKLALAIKADYPGLQDKFDQSKEHADPDIYVIEKKKVIESMKAKDLPRAREAIEAALSVRPGDAYMMGQLEKLLIEEKKVVVEEQEEAAYQKILANAKSLADKASTMQDYDLAIKEYKRAADMIPNRKFPKKKIKELTKIKNSIKFN